MEEQDLVVMEVQYGSKRTQRPSGDNRRGALGAHMQISVLKGVSHQLNTIDLTRSELQGAFSPQLIRSLCLTPSVFGQKSNI